MENNEWIKAIQSASCTPGDFSNGNIKVIRSDEAEAILNSAVASQKEKLAVEVKILKEKSLMYPMMVKEYGDIKTLDNYNAGYDKAFNDIITLLSPSK